MFKSVLKTLYTSNLFNVSQRAAMLFSISGLSAHACAYRNQSNIYYRPVTAYLATTCGI